MLNGIKINGNSLVQRNKHIIYYGDLSIKDSGAGMQSAIGVFYLAFGW